MVKFKQTEPVIIHSNFGFSYVEKQVMNRTILEVREELLNRVLERCNEIYTQNQCAKYIVSCAREAWRRIIALNFFHEEPSVEQIKSHPSWRREPEPKPCDQDSWAGNKVHMQQHKNIFSFGDNPPEAAKLSLSTDQFLCLCHQEEDSPEKPRSEVHVEEKTTPHFEEEAPVHVEESEFSADSLEKSETSDFTFKKFCPKKHIPIIKKEARSKKKLQLTKDYLPVGRGFIGDVARGRNEVKVVRPFAPSNLRRRVAEMEVYMKRNTTKTSPRKY